jgi:hypothetical protein
MHNLPGDESCSAASQPRSGYDPARPDSGTRAMIIGDRPLPHELHGAHDPLPDPEPPEVRIGPILATGAGLLMLMVIGIFVSLEMIRRWGAERVAGEPAPRPQGIFREANPKAPLLQVGGRQTMTEMRQREAEFLDSYGWIDRGQGVVHIPIEQAIDQYLSKQAAAAPRDAVPADAQPAPAPDPPAPSAPDNQ